MGREVTISQSMPTVVLTDFDGTVVDIDTGAFALEQFASGDWEDLERKMIQGELTYEECLRKQFKMINVPTEQIVKSIDAATSLRPHYAELVKYCLERSIKLTIFSGGLDFYIRHFLDKNRLGVEVLAPKCNMKGEGLDLQFPYLSDPSSFSFKDDWVRRYCRLGYTVCYVGDGYSDYYALKEASLRFAIAGSTAAKLCNSNHVQFHEIADFLPVISEVDRLEKSFANLP